MRAKAVIRSCRLVLGAALLFGVQWGSPGALVMAQEKECTLPNVTQVGALERDGASEPVLNSITTAQRDYQSILDCYGDKSEQALRSAFQYGQVLGRQGEFETALDPLREAWHLSAGIFGKKSPARLPFALELAETYEELEWWRAAIEAYVSVSKIIGKCRPENAKEHQFINLKIASIKALRHEFRSMYGELYKVRKCEQKNPLKGSMDKGYREFYQALNVLRRGLLRDAIVEFRKTLEVLLSDPQKFQTETLYVRLILVKLQADLRRFDAARAHLIPIAIIYSEMGRELPHTVFKKEPRHPTYLYEPDAPGGLATPGGFVKIALTVLPDGTVLNPIIVEAKPFALFDKAALRAVVDWYYAPSLEGHTPIRADDVSATVYFRRENRDQ